MTCPTLSAGGASAIADALQSVDCMAGEATASAFARIFGGEGLLTGALTIGLTLYVALFAIRLLTGRASIGLTALTPRMMALGLTLTFATSWVAYSQVVWTLLSVGPDWIASTMLGVRGSASHAFAGRLDIMFRAVADAAEQARQASGDHKGAGATPADLLSYAALLLLLGTIGVLVTSRIALAALLAVGPAFIILALFSGTRGLFEGWLRTAVMFALAPLFTVLIGVGAIAMLAPVVANLQGGTVDMEQAAMVFVAAAVHCALMITSLKLVAAMTTGWRLPIMATPAPFAERAAVDRVARASSSVAAAAPIAHLAPDSAPERDERVRTVVAAMTVAAAHSASDSSRALSTPAAEMLSRSPPSSIRLDAPSGRARAIGRCVRPVAPTPSIKEALA